MYDKNKLVQGYPKSISKGFKGIPNNIDAAFVFKGNLYFFKGKTHESLQRCISATCFFGKKMKGATQTLLPK